MEFPVKNTKQNGRLISYRKSRDAVRGRKKIRGGIWRCIKTDSETNQ